MDNKQQKIREIRKFEAQFKELCYPSNRKFLEKEFPKWYSFHKESELIIKSIFGENSQRWSEWKDIVIPEDPDIENTEGFYSYQRSQNIVKTKMKKQLELMIKEIELNEQEKNKKLKNNEKRKKIFIVHGTDHAPVEELKKILEGLDLQPVILEELPCGSITIIEKLEMYSDVDFAFVILTPDDKGGHYVGIRKGSFGKGEIDTIEKIKFRAHQNTILEFGYFIGRLTRKNVCCLQKKSVELPSDMNGIVYIQFENSLKKVEQRIIDNLVKAEIINNK